MDKYREYFEEKKWGKPYRTQEEYLKDAFSFLDLCIASLGELLKGADSREISCHIRGTAGDLKYAYGVLLRQLPEPEEEKKQNIRTRLQYAKQHCKNRLHFTRQQGKEFRMVRLGKLLKLTEFEKFMLLLAYAGAYDVRYEQIFSDLQGNASLLWPTISLTSLLYSLYADLPAEEFADAVQQKSIFVEYFCQTKVITEEGESFYCFTLNRISQSFLAGSDALDHGMGFCCRHEGIKEPLAEPIVRKDSCERVKRSLAAFLSRGIMPLHPEKHPEECAVFHYYGSLGNGMRLFLRHGAVRSGYGILFVDVSKLLLGGSLKQLWKDFAKLIQESILLKACLCFIGPAYREDSGEDEKSARLPDALVLLLTYFTARLPFFIWLSEEKSFYLLDYPVQLLCMEQPMLTAGERLELWKAAARQYPLGETVNGQIYANQYILSAKGIRNVLQTADFIRIQRQEEQICPGHIREAVSQQSPDQLGRFAALVPAVYTWEDLVISPEQERQMRLICNQMRYRNIVGEEWGFFRKTAYGKGICALFYGSPGTGKTMAVQVMANELGLDLYRIDISQLVSKYIGETEKNISTLFRKAKNINALLFFDEADALFAKRSEVKDSHDRNANAETAHLLQKLEDYEGITILATNYINNIDDAFKRRIKFMVHFAFPSQETRLQLWETILPKEVPLEEELDLEYYASHFELAGSNIKEILTNAAFIAASEGGKLANRHIIEAIRINFAKYGKILSDNDFGYLL